MDRYLSYVPVKSEEECWAVAGACTIISLKIRRAERECLNYRHLQAHFSGISERDIRVSFLHFSNWVVLNMQIFNCLLISWLISLGKDGMEGGGCLLFDF